MIRCVNIVRKTYVFTASRITLAVIHFPSAIPGFFLFTEIPFDKSRIHIVPSRISRFVSRPSISAFSICYIESIARHETKRRRLLVYFCRALITTRYPSSRMGKRDYRSQNIVSLRISATNGMICMRARVFRILPIE